MNRRYLLASLVLLPPFLASCELGTDVVLGRSADAPGGSASGGSEATGGSNADGGAGSGGTPAGSGGVGGAVVPSPPELIATDVVALSELNDIEKDDNPTLTSDLLLLCFTSERDGGAGDVDVWCAERDSAANPFSASLNVAEVNDVTFDTSSALSLDGLSLWFAAERADTLGGSDIYLSTRSSRNDSWGAPTNVAELNSTADDIPRPTARNGRVMPMASRRDGAEYWTYFARREDRNSNFSAPELVTELAMPGRNVVDAQLSEDGLLLVYSSAPDETDPGDLFFSYRDSTDDEFSAPIPIEGVNSDADDRDPWLSPDRMRLFFSSSRSGEFDLYEATLAP